MIKELGLVITGVVIGTAGTLYLTRELLGGPIAEKLIGVMEEIIDEEVESAKDEIYNEQVEKDNKRDYNKPLRKSGKYPWGERKSYYEEAKEAETFALPMLMTNHEDAVQVLNNLLEHIDLYKFVSIADYYDMVSVTPTYKDTLYGWTGSELKDARVVPLDGEYSIALPVAKRLNK